jgi:hypothetical protein
MNYTLESSFFDTDKRNTVLWVECLLHDFVYANERKRHLSNITKLEKRIIDTMGRCFSVECIEINKAFYLQKKGNPRAPYLCFKDYLTDNKIKKNFKDDLGFFHDDIQYFPVGYTP